MALEGLGLLAGEVSYRMRPAKCSGDGPDGLRCTRTNSWQGAADSSFEVLFVVENAKVVTWLIR